MIAYLFVPHRDGDISLSVICQSIKAQRHPLKDKTNFIGIKTMVKLKDQATQISVCQISISNYPNPKIPEALKN